MTQLSRSAVRPLASAMVLSACLTACGGSGSQEDLVSPPPVRDPSGYLYVAATAASSGPGQVLQYAINGDGSVTPLSVPSVPAGADPLAIGADPAGRYVYAVNGADYTISQYSVGAGGALAALSPAVVGVPVSAFQSGHSWVSIDPSGHYLYVVTSPPGPTSVASAAAVVSQYAIGTSGQLTPLTPAFITLPGFASGPLAIDSVGRHAYVGGGTSSNVVLQFSIGPDGALSALAPATITADDPQEIVLTPNGRWAYVLGTCVDPDCDGEVSLYTIGSDYSLNPTMFTTLTGGHILPVGLVLNSSGSKAYLLTNFMGVDTDAGKLYQYTIDNTGALASQGELDTGSAAVAAALSGNNDLYVLTSDALAMPPNGTGGHLVHISVAGSALSQVDSTPISGLNPTAMAAVTQ